MRISPGSQDDLGPEFDTCFREFKADIDGREIVLTAIRDGGPNRRVGGGRCHHKQHRGIVTGSDYHTPFRFDHTTKRGSIVVRDITAGAEPYLIKCASTTERRPAGRSDTLVLGMGLTDGGRRSDMGVQGDVNPITLYDKSMSDAGANVFDGGQSPLNNHNLAITYNGARLLKSEDNGTGLENDASCLIEGHSQPFSSRRTVQNCTDKEKEDRAGTSCYKYYAGHLNALAPRTKCELRSSIDEYVLEIPNVAKRSFVADPVGEPISVGERKVQTHLNLKVGGAGGGLAPEWRINNPNRSDAMSLGCSPQQLQQGRHCRPGRKTGACHDVGGYRSYNYKTGDHKCWLPGEPGYSVGVGNGECAGCWIVMKLGNRWPADHFTHKVRFCARPAIVCSVADLCSAAGNIVVSPVYFFGFWFLVGGSTGSAKTTKRTSWQVGGLLTTSAQTSTSATGRKTRAEKPIASTPKAAFTAPVAAAAVLRRQRSSSRPMQNCLYFARAVTEPTVSSDLTTTRSAVPLVMVAKTGQGLQIRERTIQTESAPSCAAPAAFRRTSPAARTALGQEQSASPPKNTAPAEVVVPQAALPSK